MARAKTTVRWGRTAVATSVALTVGLAGLVTIACSDTGATYVSAPLAASSGNVGFRLRLSQRLLAPAAVRQVHEETQINEWMDGAWIYGQAVQDGRTQLELRPGVGEAYVDTLYYATTVTTTTGQRDPATFWTTATTSSGSRKQVILTVDDITTKPAATNANTQMVINGVDVNVGFPFYRIALRRAWDEVCAMVPQASATISWRTSQQVNQRLDADTPAAIEASGLRDLQKAARQLREDTGLGERVRFASAADALAVEVAAADGQTLPAAPDATDVAGGDFGMALHESVVRELTTTAFGGKTMTHAEITETFKRVFGAFVVFDLGDGTAPDAQGFSMAFPAENPIELLMDDGLLTVVIKGVRFMSQNKTYELPMVVKAVYRVATDGALRLVRTGELSVLPPGFDPAHDQMTIKQQVLAGVLKTHFDPVLKTELDRSALTLPGALAQAGELSISRLAADDGWLGAAWRMSEP